MNLLASQEAAAFCDCCLQRFASVPACVPVSEQGVVAGLVIIFLSYRLIQTVETEEIRTALTARYLFLK
jgi:hypothetical protein